MSSLKTFFRHCPRCGRRFEIRLIGKKRVSSDTESFEKSSIEYAGPLMPSVVLDEQVPTLVDVEEFRYSYKCGHCGLEWTELRDTEREVDDPAGDSVNQG